MDIHTSRKFRTYLIFSHALKKKKTLDLPTGPTNLIEKEKISATGEKMRAFELAKDCYALSTIVVKRSSNFYFL